MTNALDVWYIDANLHLWLDHKSGKTTGGLVSHEASVLEHVQSEFSGLDGRFVTTASRHVLATGWVMGGILTWKCHENIPPEIQL